MRTKILFILLIIFAGNAFAAKRMLPIEHWTTKEGVRVYFVPAPEIPMLDLQIAFVAGSARDGASQAGIAQLTNQMIKEGAGELSADQIALGFDSVGAHFQQQVDKDTAKLHLRSMTAETQLTPSLALFAKILSNPTFPKSEFEHQKKSLLNTIQEQDQDPSKIASRAIWQSIYGNHPYGHPTSGIQKTVTTLTPEAARDFFNTYYVAENAVIAMVGAIDRKQAESIAANISSQLKRGKQAPMLTPADAARVAVGTQDITHPSSQTHVRLGTIGMAAGDPDFFALQIGNHVLGGAFLTSRLFKEVREKRGLSYNVASTFVPLAVPGPFVLQLQTQTKQTKTALDVAQTVMKDFIEKGPTPAELAAAKKDISGGFVLRVSSNAAIVEQLSNMGFYQLPLDYLDTYVDKINTVTIEQVKDAFKRRIDLKRFAIVLVGSAPADANTTKK
jgi:zinc protease